MKGAHVCEGLGWRLLYGLGAVDGKCGLSSQWSEGPELVLAGSRGCRTSQGHEDRHVGL